MLRILSDAALLFGLPDPVPPAEALTAARPEALGTLAAALRPVEAALVDASGTAWIAADTAGRSWSAAAPAEAIGRAAAGAGAAHGVVARIRQVTLAAAEMLAAAVTDGVAAISRAESAAASWPPLVSVVAAGGSLPGSSTDEVVAVLGRLDSELAAAGARADEAAAMILDRLVEDPRADLDDLPTSSPASVPDQAHGLAAATVDKANRAAAGADLTASDSHRRALASSVITALATHQSRGEEVRLLVYDPDAFHGQGRVAIGLGDLSRADNLAVLTPGIGNSPMASAPLLDLAARLRDQAGSTDPTAETAVVLWLGYDIPMSAGLDGNAGAHTAFADVSAALSSENAEAGGARLAEDVRRFTAMAPPSALVTLVGHSMGSVVTSQAAREPIPVDNLVLLGSPGAGPGVATAGDYPTVSAGHVFVGSHDADIITTPAVDLAAAAGGAWYLGRLDAAPFGTDPALAAFGAQDLDLGPFPAPAPNLDPIAVARYGAAQHGLPTYLEGAGLVAAGAVITGRYRSARTREGALIASGTGARRRPFRPGWGRMPGMDLLDAGAIAEHYRSVADPVARHLAGRPVISAGWSVTGPVAVATTTELAEAVHGGCRWFAVPAQAWRPFSLVRLVPGPGADTATTATVALALLETVARGEGVAIADGADGMVVALPAGVPAGATMDELAARAPELATVIAGQDAGRVLVGELTGSDPVPVPYSLIDLPDGTGVVIPLHVDEIAAAAAGMRLEFEPDDAAQRLAARGDLAVRLAGPA